MSGGKPVWNTIRLPLAGSSGTYNPHILYGREAGRLTKGGGGGGVHFARFGRLSRVRPGRARLQIGRITCLPPVLHSAYLPTPACAACHHHYHHLHHLLHALAPHTRAGMRWSSTYNLVER